MTSGADPRPGPDGSGERTGPRHATSSSASRWRLVSPIALGLCGVLFVVSAHDSEGNDLRPGRYTDLPSLVSTESRQVTGLKAQVAALTADVDRLTSSVKDRRVDRLQARAEALRGPAGLEPVTGPGVTVTLSDAPKDVINSSTRDTFLLIVHQQDIQAVVNAMWRAGARGVAVQDQRIVTTTGIKCNGNSVQLAGVPYAQPYRITAVGDQVALLRALEEDPLLQTYREYAGLPDVAVGYDLESHTQITLPGYTGLTGLAYAKVLPD